MRFRARGDSMRPAVRDGDVVEVERTGSDGVGIGDVLCYEPEPGRLTLHRLIGRDGPWLVTKGDALDWADHVPPDGVMGKVVAVRRASPGRRLVGSLSRLARRLGLGRGMLTHA